MTTVSCPRCADRVSLPTPAHPHARVKCPLCAEVFELSEVLNLLPPALIIVEMPAAVGLLAPVAASPEAAGFAPSDLEAGLDLLPTSESEHALEANLEPSELDLDESELGGGSWSVLPNGERILTPPEDGDELQLAAPAGGTSYAGTAAATATAVPDFKARPRKARKESSPFVFIASVVMGGVLGIGGAIALLWWLPGSYSKDPLTLGPPVSRYPALRWMVPERYWDKTSTIAGPALDPGPTAQKSTPKSNGGNKEGAKKSETPQPPTMTGNEASPAVPPEEQKVKPNPSFEDALNGTGGDTPADLNDLKNKLGGGGNFADLANSGEAMPDETEPGEVKPATATTDENPAENTGAELAAKKAAVAQLNGALVALMSADADFVSAKEGKDKPAMTKAFSELYKVVAQMGEARQAFTEDDSDLAPIRQLLQAAMQSAVSEPLKLNAVAALSAKQLKAGTAGGILLQGTVKDFHSAGKLFETVVELPKGSVMVAVVTTQNPQDLVKMGDNVVVLGVVLNDPKADLPGYAGEATQIVHGLEMLPVKTEAKPAAEKPAEEKPAESKPIEPKTAEPEPATVEVPAAEKTVE